MSNYPDNFDSRAFDRRWGSPEDKCPDAVQKLESIHAVYSDALKAIVESCKKRAVLISRHDLEVAMEGVGEALADDADHALEQLRECGYNDFSYTPHNAEELITSAHEDLLDSFRPKPVAVGILFKPRQLTNPATLAQQGVAL